jgi:hypothetical protein
MMKTAGVGNATGMEGISDGTRKRLDDARKKSLNQLEGKLHPVKSLSSSKSDSILPQIDNSSSSNESTDPIKETIHEVESPQDQQRSLKPSSHSSIQLTSHEDSSDNDDNVRSTSAGAFLVPSAPSSRPSSAAKNMAKRPPKKPEPAPPINETDSCRNNEGGDEEKSSMINRPENIIMKNIDSFTSLPQESPSAWSTHENDLHKDILVSQSDYVKAELISLHKSLKPLEERANVIEKEIRESMSQGDSDKEELLTVEYFKLLNEKNTLIKKQIELNLLEKEDDLEKRQFFINRELRQLAAISEENKTTEQKQREEQLIQELLQLVNEREWLDQRLTNTTKSSSEDETQMSNQDKQNDTHAGQTLSSISTSFKNKFTRERANSKDCTIS